MRTLRSRTRPMSADGLFQSLRVQAVTLENQRTRTLRFDQSMTDAQPGQYVMAWLPGVGEKPFSIAGAEPFSLTVAAVGPFSQALYDLQPGERLWVRGPLGQGFDLQGSRHLLVGGGYGVAPLLFLASRAAERGDQVSVCLGARTAEEVILASAFSSLGCELFVTTEDGSLGGNGLVTTAVAEAIQKAHPSCVYGCGPSGLLIALAKLCQQSNLPAQLSWEAHMRCGLGLCGSCELEVEISRAANLPLGCLVCKDGPVYRYSDDGRFTPINFQGP